MKENRIRPKSPKPNKRVSTVTIGMDLGDKTSRYCKLDEDGQVLEEGSVGTTRKAMTQVFAKWGCSRVVT